MARLTAVQLRMLQSVSDGAVQQNFDVYGGYWWTERGKRLPAYGKSGSFPPLPIRSLLERKMISEGENARVGSGSHRMPYVITEAGRAALAQAEGATP